jgi:hypothetical protein
VEFCYRGCHINTVKRIIDGFRFLHVPVVTRGANDEFFWALVFFVKGTAINSLIPLGGLLLKTVDTALVRWKVFGGKGALPFKLVKSLF